MSIRTDADDSYALSALRGYEYVLNALSALMDTREIWVVEIGGSSSKRYDDTISVYNAFSFRDGREIVERLEPDIVVSSAGDYEYLHRSVLKAAAYKGIPTVDILYSAFGLSVLNEGYSGGRILGRIRALRRNARSIVRRYIFLLKTLFSLRYGLADIFGVVAKDMYLPFVSWLPRYRFGGGDLNIISTPEWFDYLTKNKIDKNRIAVVGDISMDPIYDKLTKIKDRIPDKRRNTQKTEILLITSPMASHGLWTARMQKDVVTEVVKSIRINLKDAANLRVKIHPTSESLDMYKELLYPIDPNIEIIQKSDLLSIAYESDVIVSFGNSSALFEPLMLGRPVYIVNIFDEDSSNNVYLKERVAIECNTVEELIGHIKEGSNSSAELDRMSAFIRKYIYLFDGKCSERAAKSIISLLENNLDVIRR